PRAWYDGMEPSAAFMGLPIVASTGSVPGVHKKLLDHLKQAETALLGKFPGQSVDQVREKLKLYSVSGLRLPMPASGSESTPSLHCFGLAVDVNYAGSPFVGLQKPAKKLAKF